MPLVQVWLQQIRDDRLDFLISLDWLRLAGLLSGAIVVFLLSLLRGSPYAVAGAAVCTFFIFLVSLRIDRAVNQEYLRRNNYRELPNRYAGVYRGVMWFFVTAVLALGALRLVLPPK